MYFHSFFKKTSSMHLRILAFLEILSTAYCAFITVYEETNHTILQVLLSYQIIIMLFTDPKYESKNKLGDSVSIL